MKNILKRIAVVVVLFATVANMWVANTNKEVNLNTSLESLEADALPPWAIEVIIALAIAGAERAYDCLTKPSLGSAWTVYERNNLGFVIDYGVRKRKIKNKKVCLPSQSESYQCEVGTEEEEIIYEL